MICTKATFQLSSMFPMKQEVKNKNLPGDQPASTLPCRNTSLAFFFLQSFYGLPAKLMIDFKFVVYACFTLKKQILYTTDLK